MDGLFSSIVSEWSTTGGTNTEEVNTTCLDDLLKSNEGVFKAYLQVWCWQLARHFRFPRVISSPRLSEPWLLKSGLPWLPRLHIGKM